jgi:hypothetical protein
MSFRYNLIGHKEKEICTIDLAGNGLSEHLFDQGVRILKHDLSFQEAKAAYMALDGDYEFLRFRDDFQEAMMDKADKDPGRAWQSKAPNRFDERFEGITPMMQYANRRRI